MCLANSIGISSALLLGIALYNTPPSAKDWAPLFAEEGVPQDWVVRSWDDVSKPAPPDAVWRVDGSGVLHGSDPRGTWLVSKSEYENFILEFEWKLGERGNSGCGIRFPGAGDPAFDGLEIQMCDARYNEGRDSDDKLTGSIYKAIAPAKQLYKPEAWNHFVITADGMHITVELNGEKVQDIRLSDFTTSIERHDGTLAPALKERPARGHIGFQELSRGGGHVMIRNARIKVLE
ncbi:MAG: hypothetical protein AMXMBFR84_41890 [Candidatus Hydrogenedentota bacterium]